LFTSTLELQEIVMLNLNFLRTLLNLGSIAAIISAVASIFSCDLSATTSQVVCDANWVSPQVSSAVGLALQVANIFLKAFQGGAVGTGLIARTVPMVSDAKAGPGTVTKEQVEAP
jgi:hypothetical protein